MATSSLNMPYLLLSGVIGILLVSFFTLFQPILAQLNEIRTQTADQENTLQQKRDFLSGLDQKKTFLATQEQTEKKIAAMLPEGNQMEDALRLLHVAANESGGLLASLKNNSQGIADKINAERARGENNAVPEGADVLSLEVQYTGNYQQFRAFLQKVTASPRLMDVQSITLRRSGDSPDIIFASLTIYFYKLRAIVAAPSSL